ncbi:MAG TPA: VWA domain-containing protein, partial [Terracidiphilus sp.]|nr:VWA domain-containing protein [Terracidiphilus sp.]
MPISPRALTLKTAALLLAVFATHLAWGQLAPSPDASPVSNAPPPPEEDQSVATFKIEVNLVNLFFTAKDKGNSLVPHLTRNDCSVTEDKVPQTLKNFAAETDLPLTLGILLDTSGSQTRVLQLEKDAGSQFLERVLKRQDQAFLLGVDVNVDLLQDLTNSPRELTRALNKAEINAGVSLGSGPVPTGAAPRGTLLYDAVDLASRVKLREETGRKAMILLTDGEDEGSRTKLEDSIAAAERANAVVYVILIADVQSYLQAGIGYSGYSPMKKMAEETGGRVINVGNN